MKYMGSKARFAAEILPIILRGRAPGQWYVEPFAGGMNTVCRVPGNRIANDVNGYLVAMWEALVSGWIPGPVTRERYEDVRKSPDLYPDHFVGWVAFNCSYSGKWFGGYAGPTKTKSGALRDYQAEALNNVIRQAKKMQGVTFSSKSFADLEVPPNSIVYCDPPYEGTTEYEGDFDHRFFWDWARNLSRNGHTVYVSEYNAPGDFENVWRKRAKSSLSANGSSGASKTSVERLFRLSPIYEAGDAYKRKSVIQKNLFGMGAPEKPARFVVEVLRNGERLEYRAGTDEAEILAQVQALKDLYAGTDCTVYFGRLESF